MRTVRQGKVWTTFLSIILLIVSTPGFAQKVDLSKEAYIQPPEEIAELATAPWYLNVTLRDLSPDSKHFLITKRAAMPTLQIYGKPFINLGESEFDYLANRSRRFTIIRYEGFEILNYETGNKTEIQIPKNHWVNNGVWSPDGSQIAYFAHSDKATHIYVADVKNGKSKKITKNPVLATLANSFNWSQDGTQILTVLIPDKRKPMPVKSNVATEPKVRMTSKGKTPNRTYPNLMQTPYDMEMLEWLGTGQLALINVKNRKVKAIGEPAMYNGFSISPDGKYLRATSMQKPFSYHVPVRSFGTIENLYNLEGKILTKIQERKIRYSTVGGGGRGGSNNNDDKRNVTWRPDGNGISYLQMEPRKKKGEDEKDDEEAEESEEDIKRKDRLIHWLPPFDSTSTKIIYQSSTRMNSVQYSQDCQTLFMNQTEDGKQHLFALNLSDTSKKLTIYKHKTSDHLTNPGSLMMKNGEKGGSVVRISSNGEDVYLEGTKNSKNNMKNAPRPFIQKVNIRTSEKDTLFISDTDVYESISTVADDDLNIIFTTRQSPKMVADSYVRNLETDNLKKLTNNKNYAPDISDAKRLRFQIERVDGIKFWVNVTLPSDYREGTKLPAMFWFYPREFTSQKNYDESTQRYNKNSFPRFGTRSMEYLIKLGYAVVQPDCPIIGKQGQMNNNYVQDLRNNLWAVIDFLDKKEYIDRDRLGIGGHSYGAFGTANAMIHTPFFKAGIAGDGNYNRTLTPLTFQSERRYLHDAREVYISMSPIFWANQLNGALLMYHGIDDANVGTFLINSERMFHMLDGLGKTASLYMYPYEHHGPATKETILDLWGRWIEWLDKYVKNPQKEEKKKGEKGNKAK